MIQPKSQQRSVINQIDQSRTKANQPSRTKSNETGEQSTLNRPAAVGSDGIPDEALESNIAATVKMFNVLFREIWEERRIPHQTIEERKSWWV